MQLAVSNRMAHVRSRYLPILGPLALLASVALAGCSSDDSSAAGSGGASGSGGAIDAGGTSAVGGNHSTGGAAGVSGSGSATGSGSAAGAGGVAGASGSSAGGAGGGGSATGGTGGGVGGSASGGTGGGGDTGGIGGNLGKPSYKPLFAENFDAGVVGQPVKEFAKPSTPAKITYDNQVPGPFGGKAVVRQANDVGAMNFGGRIVDTQLKVGQGVWVRWYEYFPTGFCFANGTSNADGASGHLKWMRFQYPGNSERITLKLRAKAACAAPCSQCVTDVIPDAVTGEAFDWAQRYGNQSISANPSPIPIGKWHALQVYMRLSPGSADKGNGDGLLRVWVDKTLIIESQHNTLPKTGSELASVYWGNYWNGGFPATQHWYLDEVIVTSEKPDGVDASGNAFIDPARKVSDF